MCLHLPSIGFRNILAIVFWIIFPLSLSSLDPTVHLCARIYVPPWRHLMNSWALFTAIFHCVHMIENFSCLPSNSLNLVPAQIFKTCHLRVCLVSFLSWLWWNIDRNRLTFYKHTHGGKGTAEDMVARIYRGNSHTQADQEAEGKEH